MVVKLDFEHYLTLFTTHGDFKELYKYLHAVKDYVTNLYFRTQQKRKLRSGFYYIMVILTNLTNLQTVTFDDNN